MMKMDPEVGSGCVRSMMAFRYAVIVLLYYLPFFFGVWMWTWEGKTDAFIT